MNRSTLIIICTTALASQAMTTVALAGDTADLGKKIFQELKANAGNPDAMQAQMTAGMTGPAHKYLNEAFVGEWDISMKMWMDPAAPPMDATGHSSIKPILGGRYIEETFTTEMMGMPFEGRGITGYNNVTKSFVSNWSDTMSTGFSTQNGSISPDGKTLTFVGNLNDLISGEFDKPYMTKIHLKSSNSHVMEMFEIVYGEPTLVMEIIYTKSNKQAAAN